MKFFDGDLLVRARNFIGKSLPVKGRVQYRPILIAYHGDGDGCCAAYLLKTYLGRPAVCYWVPTPDFDFVNAENYVARQNPVLTVFVDMPVYNRPEMIRALASQGHVFIYDHHYPGLCDAWEGKEDVLYINPVIHQKGKEFPTALFAWELLEEKAVFEKEVLFMALFTESWLDKARLFGEFSFPRQDLLKEIAKRVHVSFLIQDMNTTHYALDFLARAREFGGFGEEQVMGMREYHVLENIYDLVQNEKHWLMKNLRVEIKKLAGPRFIVKRVDSTMRISGLIASELRWKYPGLVMGIWQRWKGRYYCELRRGKSAGVNLSSLVETIKGEVNLETGGGHPAAAAFTAEGDGFFEALDRVKHYLVKPGLLQE
jgi:hypothetical protein